MAVLVAYDGSHPAQRAVEYAITQFPDAELILLRVIEVSDGTLEAGIDLLQETFKTMRKETAAAVSEELSDLIDAADVEFRMETVLGQPAREIVSFAEEHDVDVIVIGNRGRRGVSRVLLGSVAESVVRRSPTTVIVVR